MNGMPAKDEGDKTCFFAKDCACAGAAKTTRRSFFPKAVYGL